MSSLKIGISGVRGIVGDSLTNDIALAFGRAFGTFINRGTVAVARDTRTSGDMLKCAVISGLLSTGCEVIDIGIVPTPTALFYVRTHRPDGGIIITASHNPGQWNGLKFIESDGTFLDESRLKKFFHVYHTRKFKDIPWDIYRGIKKDTRAAEEHSDAVLKSLNVKAIRKRHFKVGVDYVNGTGCMITPRFLSELGCRVFDLNALPNGIFSHEPEPIPKNLQGLCGLVKKKGLDVGFAQDPDADRLAVVSDKGLPIGEELTLGLSMKFILSYKKRGTVVTNLSASKVLDHIANESKIKLVRTKVGESNVVYEMKKRKALIGGEGNGGVIFPKINYGRDSIVAMGLILEYLARSNKKVSQLVDELPSYKMIKGKFECPSAINPVDVLNDIKQIYRDEKTDTRDGVKIIWPDKWVHIRSSNTEPIIRVIMEAETEREINNVYAQISRNINEIIGSKVKQTLM